MPQFRPRIWIGNRLKVQTHFDLLYNIACVVGGRRRFTLFPPEQVANLYLGPLDFTPAGRARQHGAAHQSGLRALSRASPRPCATRSSAELEPGDALYIPYAWWHHVESLTPFNVLVNYWWNAGPDDSAHPYAVLLHAALSLRDLPADQREVWKSHVRALVVFRIPEEALGHLPPAKRGLLGPPSAQRTREIRAHPRAGVHQALRWRNFRSPSKVTSLTCRCERCSGRRRRKW